MVIPTAGAIVIVRFPFSDLSQTKLRPAVVLADAGRGDWILCQVTSKPYGDSGAIMLEDACFSAGSLRVSSHAPPGKLFTANRDLIVSEVATLKLPSLKQVVDAVVDLLRAGHSSRCGLEAKSSKSWPAFPGGLDGSNGLWRYSSGCALTDFGLFPIIAALLRPTAPFALFSVLVTTLVEIKHKGNIERLWSGTENKMGERKA